MKTRLAVIGFAAALGIGLMPSRAQLVNAVPPQAFDRIFNSLDRLADCSLSRAVPQSVSMERNVSEQISITQKIVNDNQISSNIINTNVFPTRFSRILSCLQGRSSPLITVRGQNVLLFRPGTIVREGDTNVSNTGIRSGGGLTFAINDATPVISVDPPGKEIVHIISHVEDPAYPSWPNGVVQPREGCYVSIITQPNRDLPSYILTYPAGGASRVAGAEVSNFIYAAYSPKGPHHFPVNVGGVSYRITLIHAGLKGQPGLLDACSFLVEREN